MVNQVKTVPTPSELIEEARRKRWTRDEYHQMSSIGLLPGHYELIDGEILEKMSKNRPHVLALALLAAWLESIFGRYFVQTQDPIVVSTSSEFGTEPEPDVAVTRASMFTYASDGPGAGELLLVAEVSDTTLNYDLYSKAKLYGTAGIPEYWVLDISGRRLLVHHLPYPEGYREVRVYLENEQVATLSKPDDSILVASLLPSVPNE